MDYTKKDLKNLGKPSWWRKRLDQWQYSRSRLRQLLLKVQLLEDAYEGMERRKNEAYLERNRVVALLARLYPAGIKRTVIDGWHPEWHNAVFIDLPNGQVSWHYHDSHAYLFEGLPPYLKEWDGHTTEAKYDLLIDLTDVLDMTLPREYDDDQSL